ncbi:Hybrid sensory histidine kinase EvgS [Pseudomonas sp. R4-35-07]|uniref:ATP-binding protein n=1 Tax=Pseudomonas sp. R4-35-07 TaxID=658643 RepID=UPI000F58C06E|nr:transporter substrate-binding domain-containing protein [Pseudomonas sp. R4-35-07]AZF31616.1 Hybrid sensory histidine kinase EvgS [Pseudomonas sp. R4-35-07]
MKSIHLSVQIKKKPTPKYIFRKTLSLNICAALWIALFAGPEAHASRVDNLELFSHTNEDHQKLNLDYNGWRWLKKKKTLVLGTSLPDYPPLDISSSNRDYEGITADYMQIISGYLGVTVDVRRYATHMEAVEALKTGEIDLLGSANRREKNRIDLALSNNYLDDRLALIGRIGISLSFDDKVARIRLAIDSDYISEAAARRMFPQANIEVFTSTENAIAAVAFGQADAFLGDAISSQYLISRNYSSHLDILDIAPPAQEGFSFAINADNPRLLNLINTALGAVPEQVKTEIQTRWSEKLLFTLQPLDLSADEKDWIKKNPVVNIAVSRYLAPVSYFDIHGNYFGITRDLLKLIERKTGLKFNIQPHPNIREMQESLKAGRVQIATDLPKNQENMQSFLFGRPYLIAPYALVVRNQSAYPDTLEALAGRTLSVAPGHALLPMLREHYPLIRLKNAENNFEALAWVEDGSVDATILPAPIASYNLRSRDNSLKIASIINSAPATASLSVLKGQGQLYAILDKTIRSIPPDVIDSVTNRWRTNAVIAPPSWRDYRQIIFKSVVSTITLLTIALGWGIYLRRQIMQRRAAERELSNQLHFMEALINGTPHPIYVRDLENRLLICNDSYVKSLSNEGDIARGLSSAKTSLERSAAYEKDCQTVLQTGQPLLRDREVYIAGRHQTIYHWMLPFSNSEGANQGLIGGWIDITERHLLLEELKQAKNDADEANRTKTTFLATMSHEIRTPMNAIIGLLELSLKRDKEKYDRSSIEVAYHSARGLLDLIGDILDIARIETGHLSLNQERANLKDLVESVIRVFSGLAKQKNLTLKLDINESINYDVLVDPLRFKQVLSNLISNAIKFTENGGVDVVVHSCLLADDQLQVEFSVNDTGIGISANDIARLFQPFTQIGGTRQHARSGTGLGLMISRNLCEMMGGQLELDSEIDQGTQAIGRLTLNVLEPRQEKKAEVLNSSAANPAPILGVLVVDDNYANRLLLSEQLIYLGHSVHLAENGAEGLALWKQKIFDVIITDCNMPVMSGYELAKAIRVIESAQNRVRSIILGFTANAQREERERCISAGMDDCLFKPVELDTLERFIKRSAIAIHDEINYSESNKFDLNTLEHLTGGDLNILKRVLDGLINSITDDLEELRRLNKNDNLRGLSELAHKIKGSARVVKVRSLIKHCEALEASCHLDPSDSNLPAVVLALDQAMVGLERDLIRQRKKHFE